MKLSISNIAWPAEHDEEMFVFLAGLGYSGLEIAPTRLFPENPYRHTDEAAAFARRIKAAFGLEISSVQSLLYGRNENIFAGAHEREILLDYLRQAVRFAGAVGCDNLVFGSPKNRNMPSVGYLPAAAEFFREIGDYAYKHGAVIAFEPIPAYYGTNLINTTAEAAAFCRQVDSPGFRINYDLGTALYNKEKLSELGEDIALVHHIHLSEPMLAALKKRALHRRLKQLDYNGYASIEMKRLEDIRQVKDIALYISNTLA